MSQRLHFSLLSLPAALTLTVLTACGPSPTGSQSSPGTLSTHSPAPIHHSTLCLTTPAANISVLKCSPIQPATGLTFYQI